VDFGLAKHHLNKNMKPVSQRKKADFRGTVSFASLNAHNNVVCKLFDSLGPFTKRRSVELVLCSVGLL
jgi:hypothetical protein